MQNQGKYIKLTKRLIKKNIIMTTKEQNNYDLNQAKC